MGDDRAWGSGGFSILVNLDPPKGTDCAGLLRSASLCKGRVDGILIEDGADGIMRMSPLGACWALLQKGFRPVLGMNARDRNRLAMQGDLLSAWNIGIRHIHLKEGKDPSFGDHPLTKPFRDVSIVEAAGIVAALNQGRDMAGYELAGSTDFQFGVFVDWSDDQAQIDAQFTKMRRMADAGARTFFISPQFDIPRVKDLVRRAKEMGVAVFIGILLLKSVGMARYLNEVPGIAKATDEVIRKLVSAPVKARAGIEIAAESIRDLQGVADGVVIHPVSWDLKLPELLDAIGR